MPTARPSKRIVELQIERHCAQENGFDMTFYPSRSKRMINIKGAEVRHYDIDTDPRRKMRTKEFVELDNIVHTPMGEFEILTE